LTEDTPNKKTELREQLLMGMTICIIILQNSIAVRRNEVEEGVQWWIRI
jgi:hypothetical protein